MRSRRPLPAYDRRDRRAAGRRLGATWRWAHRALPAYLLGHSVRAYCWGAAIAAGEGWTFDRQILWTASLMHDYALTRIPRNTMCFEVEGAEIARRFLERAGMDPEAADRAAIAIILHMRAGVTLADGVESVLLDRATGPRRAGRRLRAGRRGAAGRHEGHSRAARSTATSWRRSAEKSPSGPTCESNRLLNDNDLAGWMARSPWRRERLTLSRQLAVRPPTRHLRRAAAVGVLLRWLASMIVGSRRGPSSGSG